MTSTSAASPERGARLTLVAGVPIAALWIALTALTGKTYHLAPLLVAAAPGILARSGPRLRRRATWSGVATTLAAWLVIAAAGLEPSATIIEHQPGGVPLETAAFGALGAAIGAGRGPTWLVRRLLLLLHPPTARE
jgi:hypothetical protein